MQAVNFLPQSQIALNNLLLFGVLLLAGLLSGYLFHAALRLPRIVGFVAVGMLLGPSGLNWLTDPTLEDAQVFVDIGLGLVLYELGNRLDLKWLARNRWLLASGIAESALAFLCVYLALYSLSVQPLLAALLVLGMAMALALLVLSISPPLASLLGMAYVPVLFACTAVLGSLRQDHNLRAKRSDRLHSKGVRAVAGQERIG